MTRIPKTIYLIFLFLILVINENKAFISIPDSTQIDSIYHVAIKNFEAGKLEFAMQSSLRGLELAREDNNYKARADFNYLLGKISLQRKNLESSFQYFLYALFFSEEQSIDHPEIKCINFYLGKVMADYNLYEEAIRYFTAALSIDKSDCIKESKIYTALGNCYQSTNQLEKALSYYQKGLLHAFEQDKDYIPALSESITVSTRLQDYQAALKSNKKLIDLLSRQKSKYELIDAYVRQGYLYRMLNHLDSAIDIYQRAINLSSNVDAYPDSKLAFLYNNYGLTLTKANQFLKSEQHHHAAADIFEGNRNSFGLANTFNLLAGLNLLKGKYVMARENSEHALEISNENQYFVPAIESLSILIEIANLENDFNRIKELSSQKELIENLNLEKQNRLNAEQMEKRNNIIFKRNEIIDNLEEEKENLRILKQLQLEDRQKAQALELQQNKLQLLQKDKELQRQLLEKNQLKQLQTEQNLLLAEQLLETQRKDNELKMLAEQRQKQELMFKKDKIEDEARLKEIQLLESEKLLQQSQLEQEKRNFIILLSSLIFTIIIILLVVYLLVLRNLKNKKLSDQRKMIELKNHKLTENQARLNIQMHELKNAQEIIKKQKDLLLVTGNFGLFEIDFKTRSINCNERLKEFFNIRPAADINTFDELVKLVHQEDQTAFQEKLNTALSGRDSMEFEFRSIDLNGKTHYLTSSIRPIKEQSNEIKAVVGVILDISAVKDKENELQNSNQALTKINSELDHFVYRTSHNLRAPLTSILGLVNLLKTSKEETEQRNYLDLIGKSVSKLDETIQEINRYSKNARADLIYENILIRDLVEEVIESLMYMNNQKLEYDLQIPEDLIIQSDAERLKIIFNNLISNSLKYTHPAHPVCKVKIEIKKESNHFTIVISDRGMGIPEESLPKIFNMFYRATNLSYGSGLGLYIVKESVQKLKGNIEVNSELEKGATFSITIPITERPEASKESEETTRQSLIKT